MAETLTETALMTLGDPVFAAEGLWMKKKRGIGKLDQVLTRLSLEQTRAILRALAQDPNLAPLILQAAQTQLEEHAPHSPDDAEAIAEEVLEALERLEVEEVWERAGPKRDGYVDTSEAADAMIGEALQPFLEEMARYNDLGMADEAIYTCLGILSGLYRFEAESASEFKDWAADLPGDYGIVALEEWQKGAPPQAAVRKLRGLIEDSLPRWATSLLRGLKARPNAGRK
jgi:hypothetical protein